MGLRLRPDWTSYSDDYPEGYKKNVSGLLQTYISQMDSVKLRAGLQSVLHLSALDKKLLQDNKLDNKWFIEEPERCAAVVGLALNHIYLLANVIEPYMPATARGGVDTKGESTFGIFQQLGVEPVPHIPDEWETNMIILPGHRIGRPSYLLAGSIMRRSTSGGSSSAARRPRGRSNLTRRKKRPKRRPKGRKARPGKVRKLLRPSLVLKRPRKWINLHFEPFRIISEYY
ncbi:hypothetical protein QBC33DRAFT_543742 [Phialemonium atrogriseum]|uniref:Methionyl-tRNA synthetase anticodon-binding domain-containing protein n=1 Tax=Phialemonium atrogriseum TaxID=1093897 RepID=A0AAJ0FKM1_9PEZI|nr:uncharacterized protein QBC33DRAFT_543742 [Phialemonium atrogriseum]KAK1765719.1 hypothetical protein QBC33DRAFT_543742 [Phialemonium atrogriseum]